MIYLANDCFTEANRQYNEHLAQMIRGAIPKDEKLYLPQENTEINDKTQYANSVDIVEGDNKRLDQTDLLIVVLDNLESGAGRCAEIGYAAAKGINMIGLWTDTRQQGTDNEEKIEALKNEVAENQFAYINLYVIGLIKQHGVVVNGVDELIDQLNNYYSTTQHEPSLIEENEQSSRGDNAMYKMEAYADELYFSIAEFLIDYTERPFETEKIACRVDNVIRNLQWLATAIGVSEFMLPDEVYFVPPQLIAGSAIIVNHFSYDDSRKDTTIIKDVLNDMYGIMNAFANKYLELTLDQCRAINRYRP